MPEFIEVEVPLRNGRQTDLRKENQVHLRNAAIGSAFGWFANIDRICQLRGRRLSSLPVFKKKIQEFVTACSVPFIPRK